MQPTRVATHCAMRTHLSQSLTPPLFLQVQHSLRRLLDSRTVRACAACGLHGLWQLCSGCRASAYCSTACQTQDWLAHRSHCGKRKVRRQVALCGLSSAVPTALRQLTVSVSMVPCSGGSHASEGRAAEGQHAVHVRLEPKGLSLAEPCPMLCCIRAGQERADTCHSRGRCRAGLRLQGDA